MKKPTIKEHKHVSVILQTKTRIADNEIEGANRINPVFVGLSAHSTPYGRQPDTDVTNGHVDSVLYTTWQ